MKGKDEVNENTNISPDMSILDVISRYPETESIFKKYDKEAGICLCCNALFESIKDVAHKYNINLEKLITDLKYATKNT